MERFLLLGKFLEMQIEAKMDIGCKGRVQTPRARPMIRDIQDTLLL